MGVELRSVARLARPRGRATQPFCRVPEVRRCLLSLDLPGPCPSHLHVAVVSCGTARGSCFLGERIPVRLHTGFIQKLRRAATGDKLREKGTAVSFCGIANK